MIPRLLKTLAVFVVCLILIGAGIFFFFREEALTSHGPNTETGRFTVGKGESFTSVAERLQNAGYIKSRSAFLLYTLETKKYHSLQAGDYALSGEMTIPEIVDKMATGKVLPPGVRITFPEGWTLKQMADRLTANNLPGDDFLNIATQPFPKWKTTYSFLADLPAGASLEGYLFPDTYIFPPQATGELIVNELLKNFGKKVTEEMRQAGQAKSMTLHQVITMASIVEAEVNTDADRKMVADIFLRRLSAGQPLQSDATLRYALGTGSKVKYSTEETKTPSLYNTYLHPGLPPGPINNPSLEAVNAVLNPTRNDYFYFLNNAETGATVYSKTFDEHVQQKAQNGL